MQKFCTSCGAQLSEGAKICSNCGSGQLETNSNPDFAMDSISAAPVEPTMTSLDSTPTAEPMMSSFEPTPTAEPMMSSFEPTPTAEPMMSSFEPTPTAAPMMSSFGGAQPMGSTAYSQTATAAPIQNSAPVYYSENVAPMPPFVPTRSTQKPKLIFILIGVIVGLAIFFATSGGVGSDNGPYTKPVKSLVDGMNNKDWDLYISAIPPQKAAQIQKQIEDAGIDKETCMEKLLSDEYGSIYGDNIKVKFKVVSKKEITGTEFEAAQKKYNSLSGTEEKFEKIYELKCKETFKGDKSSKTGYEKMRVAQIDGEWYFIDSKI